MASACGCGRAPGEPSCLLADVRVAPSWPADQPPRMLPDVHRMRTSGDFTATVRTGVRVSRTCLVVHARTAGPPSRVGFVVSKAVGNAVVRNRVKRRLRHSLRDIVLRDIVGTDPADRASTTNVQVVVRALPRSARVSYTELDREVTSAWKQADKKLVARSGGARL